MGQLEDMQVFVRVIEAGGVGKAADQLGLAKSAVSRRLKELEARLGVELLYRTTRRSSLTESGRHYYERSLSVIDDVSELNAQTADRSSLLMGTLRIAVPVSFGLAHLAPAVSDFMGKHPGLNIQLNFSDRHIDLVEEGVDLAFRIGDLADSTLRARKISPIRIILCASPCYLAEKGAPQVPSELNDHALLKYNASSDSDWRLMEPNGKEHRVALQPVISANNGDFLRDMAVAGKGITATPTFISWQAIAKGELVPVLPNYALPLLHAYVVYPGGRYLPQRARLFIDFLAERFGEQPYWDATTAPFV
ncbi:LysR family transcriptional regulator [Teredinibacter purpureus]|uniref:LysR family transcriptional regulator n=1 Tax=Teredinibacter purpureus TaxID=2731756 RepID=UPI0005F7A28D|nr:LysR family transcriptional regulator [Teredinibacter purpureus]